MNDLKENFMIDYRDQVAPADPAAGDLQLNSEGAEFMFRCGLPKFLVKNVS